MAFGMSEEVVREIKREVLFNTYEKGHRIHLLPFTTVGSYKISARSKSFSIADIVGNAPPNFYRFVPIERNISVNNNFLLSLGPRKLAL